MRVAFWNVNMGKSSQQQKKNAFLAWVEEIQPEILILEELSSTLAQFNDIGLFNGTGTCPQYRMLGGYVNTLDRNGASSTKCLCALKHPNYQPVSIAVRGMRFHGLDQRRMLIKVTCGNISVWGIHANASNRGGNAATDAVKTFLNTMTGKNTVVGGDFNLPIQNSIEKALDVVAPLSHQNTPLNFTQWNSLGDNLITSPTLKDQFHLTRRGFITTLNPNAVIDYVAHGNNRTVIALDNCTTENTWMNILINFDHCPVYYNIT